MTTVRRLYQQRDGVTSVVPEARMGEVRVPNYVYDLWMPLLGVEAIGVYAVYLRLMRGRVVKGIAQADIARACRVGNRRLAIINQTLEQCGFIAVSKPTGADRVQHFTTEITVNEAPCQISQATINTFYTNEKSTYQPLPQMGLKVTR
jgi:hypothetical protein